MANPNRAWTELAREVIAFVLLATAIVLLWFDNLMLLGVLSAYTVVVLSFWHERRDIAFFLIIGLFGSVAEVAFVSFGVWRYANRTALGIPLWFPVAFGTSSVIGARFVGTATALWETIDFSSAP